MRNRLLALLLGAVMTLSLAACTTAEDPNAGGSEAEISDAENPSTPGLPDSEPAPREPIADEPVATLGDKSVSVLDFAYCFLSMESDFQSYYGMTVMDIDALQPGFADQIKQDALFNAIEYDVLYDTITAMGRTLPEEEMESLKASVVDEVAAQGGEQEFLNVYRLTSAQFLDLIYRYQLTVEYWNEVVPALAVTDEEMRETYNENRDMFDSVTVRHVLVAFEPDNPDKPTLTNEEASAKAQDILTQLNGGADIAALVAEHSDDGGSLETQGEYTFPAGQMVKPFEEWAFDAARKQGDTGVVETEYGFHVMQYHTRTGYEDADPEAVRNEAVMRKFYAEHAEAYDIINSEDWVINEGLIQKIMMG